MTPWYNLGRHTAVRTVSWIHITHKLFSTKLMYSGLVSNELNRFAMRSLFRRYIPFGREVLFNVQVKLIHEGPAGESDSELEESSEEIIDLCTDSDTFSLRKLLYPNLEHPLIKQLNASTSVQDVFNFIKEHECNLDEKLVSQAVLVLWDLQKIFFKVNVIDVYQNPIVNSLLSPFDNFKYYIKEVKGHPDFELLLQFVDKFHEHMSVDALTTTFLYLNKMGVSLHHSVMQNLGLRCETMVECCGPRFPLSALSRFTVTINSQRGLWPIFISKKTLPLILSGIECCNSVEDFRLLTICLVNVRQLVSHSILNLYKSKAENLVDNGIITAQDSRVIAKAVKFLNFPYWSNNNAATIRKLLLVLKGHVCELSPRDLIIVHKVLEAQLEPADIMYEMQEAATQFLSQVDNERITNSPLAFHVTTDLLSCLVFFSSPAQKLGLEKLTLKHIEGSTSPASLPTLFKILRRLKTSNIELCNAYWSRTLEYMKNIPAEREDYNLFRIAHRYMHFNNNLGGTYRHYELEKQLIHWLWNEVENGIAGVIPYKFARIASFVLAYGNIGHRRSVFPDAIVTEMVSKLLSMAHQLNKTDCLYISRGLQIGMRLGAQRRNMSSCFLEMFTNIDAAMNSCAFQHLRKEVSTLHNINRMMKSYISRRGIQDTELFEKLIERYKDYSGDMSSRQLRDATNNLLIMECLEPNILDQMVNYIVENSDHVLGDTVVRVLFLCYSLGYTPIRDDAFFSVVSNIILRDKEQIQGLILLQAAIALCFFHHLAEDFIHFIFTVDFLERLDEEVLNCYAKTYPMRVRHAMMQLNRAVCLDYPESDVPWFHEKYCQQIASREYIKSSNFREDVHQNLIFLLGREEFVQRNKHSPYYYGIDFQVLLNKDQRPVSARHQADTNITRIAVLLRDKNAYTSGVTQLCGEQQLKQRHLEMLGYRVIGIASSLWNSMYMSEPRAKADYLQNKLWPLSTDRTVQHHYTKS